MNITLACNLQSFLSDATSLFPNPKVIIFPLIKPQLCSSPSTFSVISQRSLFLSQIQIKRLVICAGNRKRRSGYPNLNQFVLKSIYLFAKNSDFLPEPWASIVKEFGGGKGGGVRFFKGFGDGGYFKKNKNLLFLAFVTVFGFVMWFGLGKRLEYCDLIFALSVVIFLGVLIGKRGVKNWVQGVCVIATIGFLGLRRENLQRAMKEFGVMINSRKRKRRAA